METKIVTTLGIGMPSLGGYRGGVKVGVEVGGFRGFYELHRRGHDIYGDARNVP